MSVAAAMTHSYAGGVGPQHAGEPNNTLTPS